MPKWTTQLRETRHFHAHGTARFDALSGLQLAGFKQRLLAIAIDFAIIAIAKGIMGIGHHHEGHEGPVTLASLLVELWQKIEELIEATAYFAVALKVGNGQTIGKKIMKIRVLSLTHTEIGWWQSIERALGYGASLLEGGFGFLQYFINRNRQTVHDRIAETIVVDENPTARRLLHEESEVVPEG
jgi:uncharacterized RDD family membrane protein YckC